MFLASLGRKPTSPPVPPKVSSNPLLDLSVGTPPSVCFVQIDFGVGGAQQANLRWFRQLPPWVRERSYIYAQSWPNGHWPLVDAMEEEERGHVVREKPRADRYLCSCAMPIHEESNQALVVHGEYQHWPGHYDAFYRSECARRPQFKIAFVSQSAVASHWPQLVRHGLQECFAGVLSPIVYSFDNPRRLIRKFRTLLWSSRPSDEKGIFSLPYLAALDPKLKIIVQTGVDPGYGKEVVEWQERQVARFKALAEKLGVTKQIEMRGFRFNTKDYSERYRSADLFLLPSKTEGMPLVLSESLACGVPVLATDIPSILPLVPNGTGALVPWSADPKALAESIHAALKTLKPVTTAACVAAARDRSIPGDWAKNNQAALLKLCGCDLGDEDSARVTIGVRFHIGGRVDWLDQAMASVQKQTYRKFRVVLLVDGPVEDAERVANRYGVAFQATGKVPHITHMSGSHRAALENCPTEFYKPLDFDDMLAPGYLDAAVRAMDEKKLDLYACRIYTMEGDKIAADNWPGWKVEEMRSGNAGTNAIPHVTVLLRTSAVVQAGNYLPACFKVGDDDFGVWVRMAETGAKLWRDDSRWNALYRKSESQSSGRKMRTEWKPVL